MTQNINNLPNQFTARNVGAVLRKKNIDLLLPKIKLSTNLCFVRMQFPGLEEK